MNFYGSALAERLVGAANDDAIYSNGGADTLEGGAGRDEIYGGNDADRAFGGDGDDRLYGNEGSDTLVGDAGADRLYGAGGDDLIFGDQPGENAPAAAARVAAAPAFAAASAARSLEFFIAGEPGAKVTVTEAADGSLVFKVEVVDQISGGGDAVDIADLRGLFFHVADESLLGGLVVTGADVTQARAEADGVSNLGAGVNMEGREHQPFDLGVEFGTPGVGTDDLRETTFILHHATKPLTLELIAGQWFGVRMTSVSDNGLGRELSLKLVGQAGQPSGIAPPVEEPNPTPPPETPPPSGALDPVAGHDDLIEGGAGHDTIDGGAGDDEIQGEGGDDVILGGADNGLVSAASGGLLVTVGDNLYGNDGRDAFLFGRGDGVDLIWDFQPGQDVIRVADYTLADARFGYLETVANRIATGAHGKIAILLGDGGDAIILNDYPNPSAAGAVIRFADGATLDGLELLQAAQRGGVLATVDGAVAAPGQAVAPTGQNLITGGDLADTLAGTAGQDYMRGGDGDDVMNGGYAFDDLNGNQGNDVLHGQSGNDWVVGGRDQDQLFGDEGDDVVYGNRGEDTVDGGDGADILRGGQGNDLVSGGSGDDWLWGDRGDDTLSGGAGADTFHSFAEAGVDRIVDFNAAEGDRLRLDAGTSYTVGQVGADVVVDMGGGNQAILAGVQLSTLPAGWLLVA